MDELDPRLRSLLNAAQEGDDPSEHDAARVRAAVALTLAEAAPGAGKPASGGASSILKWLGIGVVASGLIAAGIALNQRAPSDAPRDAPRAPQAIAAPAVPQAPEPPRPPPKAPAPEAASAATAAPPVEAALPEAPASPATHKQPRRALAPRVVPEPAPEPIKSTGPSELSLIRSATGALRDAQPSEAIRLLEQHAQLYPEGILKQERQGLQVLALCALGTTSQALHERERFLKAAPHSPLAGRVEAACGDREAP